MTHARTGRRILPWLVLSLVLVVGLLGFTYRFVVSMGERDAEVERIHVTLERIQFVLYELSAAESATRAYVITGDESRVSNFHVELRAIESDVRSLTGGDVFFDEEARAKATAMARLVHERLGAMRDLVATRRFEGLGAAQEKVTTGAGAKLTGRIRELAEWLEAGKRAELARLHDRQQTEGWALLALFSLGLFLNVVLVGFAFVVSHRALRSSVVLLGELEHSSRELGYINRLGEGLLACRTLAEARTVVAHFMARLFPDDAVTVLAIHASRNAMEVFVSTNDPEARTLFPVEDCWALRHGRAYLVTPDGDALRCPHSEGEEGDGLAHLCVPMIAQTESVGVFSLSRRADAAQDAKEWARMAETTAAQIASAIASLSLREALRNQSIRDSLTGLFNRRFLEESLLREQLRAERANGPLSIIMFDLDHFKRFNDTFGHPAGDRLLQAAGALIARRVRGEDIACRYGGEEFTVVMPGATLEQAARRAEDLREAIGALELRWDGRITDRVTASLGVACFPDHGERWEDVLRVADEALYEAKHGGRDQVVIAKGPPLVADAQAQGTAEAGAPSSADAAPPKSAAGG